MTFEEILDQAIAMLQRLAVDEDGEVLVWTGSASTTPASIASPPPHGKHPTPINAWGLPPDQRRAPALAAGAS